MSSTGFVESSRGIGSTRVQHGAVQQTIVLTDGWLFGRLSDGALERTYDESRLERVSLPHCVTKLSWRQWDPQSWESEWVYRRHVGLTPDVTAQRVFLHFDGVMVGATPVINGHRLPTHLGGYLPFEYEITQAVVPGDNVLAIAVDSRWTNVPPEGSPRGPRSIDYLEPGGITRPVSLRVVPRTFISDVFARSPNVLDSSRRLNVTCSIDAAVPSPPLRVDARLLDGARVIARADERVTVESPGRITVDLTLSNIRGVKLWHVDEPQLYEVVVRLLAGETSLHEYRTRIGLRDARFETDGFFLNGNRFRIFGLNRHELYPYVGFAMPESVHRRDAEVLRHTLNCNFVRCSHYPQSDAFLDACDELGLMVWEELPGWQYLGDQSWQDQAVADVRDMVLRDRNRPSIVVWGVRINESANNPALYGRTREAAKALDPTRPTSGTMTKRSTENWSQDVFAYDNYQARPDGSVNIAPALPNVPYLVSEGIGQFNYDARKGFDAKYRRAGDVDLQQKQAIRHAQGHDRGADDPRCAGLVAWCAFDYGSQINAYDGVKSPGVVDIFRIPKLGASFYMAQVDPRARAVIEPNFYWDFGPQSPGGPGKHAALFSNCDALDVFVDGKPHARLQADRVNYPHLRYPPFFVDLAFDGMIPEDLRIDGSVGGRTIVSRSFSSDRSRDRLVMTADRRELRGDGSDAVRLEFKAADRFGALRPFTSGVVTFDVTGPAELVGDNPFDLEPAGGAGAVWIKATRCNAEPIRVTATHAALGTAAVHITVLRDGC